MASTTNSTSLYPTHEPIPPLPALPVAAATGGHVGVCEAKATPLLLPAAIATPIAAAKASPTPPAPPAAAAEWQWLDDRGWMAYPAPVSQLIEHAASMKLKECKLTINGSGGTTPTHIIDLRDVGAECQININTGFARAVRRVLPLPLVTNGKAPTAAAAAHAGGDERGAAWQWEDQPGVWILYDDNLTDQLETAYQSKHSHTAAAAAGGSVVFMVGRTKYIVDVRRFAQTNANTGFIRRIRRLGPQRTPLPSAAGKVDAAAGHDAAAADTNIDENNNGLLPEPTAAATKAADTSTILTPVDKSVAGNEQCSICFESFDDLPPFRLIRCSDKTTHYFHEECITRWLKERPQCPVCNTIVGTITGNQPDGRITVVHDHAILAGFESDSKGSLVITFHIPSGTQGAQHAHPGRRYDGTTRRAWLPDNSRGRQVCELIKVAFDRRLMFTVGRSITTGMDDCVIWNGIHCKTSATGGAHAHGYPDATYLDRVVAELATKGVTVASIPPLVPKPIPSASSSTSSTSL